MQTERGLVVLDYKTKYRMITIVYIILIAVLVLFSYISYKAANKYLKYPFQNWEKSDLPYITIDVQGHQLNMIADSGGGMSVIRKEALDKISYTPSTRIVEMLALSNEGGLPSEVVTIPITINGKEFETDFLVFYSDDIGGFKRRGISMDGLLGVEFFKKTGGIVDFNTKTVKFP